jgi:hypothetical protein
MNDDLRFPISETPNGDALPEPDERKIAERANAAKTAIFQRLQAIANQPDGYIEPQAMDAILTDVFLLERARQKESGPRFLRIE